MSKISSPDEGACKREEDNVIPFLCLASASLPPKSNDAQANEEAARRLQEEVWLEDKNNDDASDAGSDVAVASPVESRKKARQEPAAAAVSYCSNCAKSCDAPKGSDTYLSTRKDTLTYPKYKLKIVRLWDELWVKSVYGDNPDCKDVAQGLYDELSAEGDLYRGSPGGNSFHLATKEEAIEKIRSDLKRGKYDHKDSLFYKKGSSPGKGAKPVDDVAHCNESPKKRGDATDDGKTGAKDHGEQASVSFHCTTCGKDFTFKNARVAPAAFKNHMTACKKKHEEMEATDGGSLGDETRENDDKPESKSAHIDPDAVKEGARVFVEHKGEPWRATIVERHERDGQVGFRIHWDGSKEKEKARDYPWVDCTRVLSFIPGDADGGSPDDEAGDSDDEPLITDRSKTCLTVGPMYDTPPNKRSPTTKKSGGSRVAEEFELVLVDGKWLSYKGELKNEKPHGCGTMRLDDNSEWTGTFIHGQRNAYHGTLKHLNGEEYTGKFKGKHYHGKGVLKKRDLDGWWMKIEGQWERCEIKGKCKITYGDSTDHWYKGTIDQHDRPHGQGSHRNINGDKLTGIWVHGVISKGTKEYSDGAVYEGELKDEEPHGRGKLTWTDGGSYEGDYKDGVGCGKGTFRYASNDVYVGNIADDDENGNGTMTYANGDVYVGQWKDGDRHGHGKMTFVNGDTFEGEWMKDEELGAGELVPAKTPPAGVTDDTPAKLPIGKSGGEGTNGAGETPPEAEFATKPADAETETAPPKAACQRSGQQDILLSEDDHNSIMMESFQKMDKSGKSPSEIASKIFQEFCSHLKKSGGSFKRKVARAFFLTSDDEVQSIIRKFVSAQFEVAQNEQKSEEAKATEGVAAVGSINIGVEEGREEEKSGASQTAAVGNLPGVAQKPPAVGFSLAATKPAALNEQNSECGTKRAASDAESLASDKRQKRSHEVNRDSKPAAAGNSAGSPMKQDPADDTSHGSTLIKDEDELAEKKNGSSLFGSDDADESEKLVDEIASRYSAAETDGDADRFAFYDYLLKYFVAKGYVGSPERKIVVEAMKRYESMSEKVKNTAKTNPVLQWRKNALAKIFTSCKEKLPLSSDGDETGSNDLP